MRILIVDDDKAVLEQAKIYLEEKEERFDIDTAISAEKALSKLGEIDYDAVVSDYQMPEMDGLEFLRTVREERGSDIPFIIFTGRGREEVAIDALNLGADRYIQKGGDPRSQYGILSDAIKQEIKLYDGERARRRLSSIVQSTQSAIISKGLHGSITSWNEGAEEIYGYGEEEVLGVDISLLAPEDKKNEPDQFLERIKNGEKVGPFETTRLTKDGKEIHVSVTVSPIYDEDGDVMGASAIQQDVTEKKEAEHELLEKERAIQNSLNGMAIADLDGTVRYVNRSLVDMFGYDREEEILHEDTVEFFHDEERAAKAIEELFDEGNWQGEMKGVRKDGTLVDIYLSSNLIKDEDGRTTGLLGSMTDISELKEKEQKLRKSEERLRRSQDLAKVGTWEIDLESADLTWSDETYRIFGVPKGESMDYDSFLELVHPEDRDHVEEEWKKGLQRGEYDIEHRIISDDEIRWVREKADIDYNENGEPADIVGSVQDITERKRTEEELQRYKLAVEASEDQIAAVDDEYRYLFVNEAFLEYHDLDREEVIGEKVDKVVGERAFEETVKPNIDGCLNGGTLRYNMSKEYPGKGRVHLDVLYYPFDLEEENRGVVAVIRDVSKEKENEERLRERIERDRRLFDALGDAVLIVTVGGDDHGEILMANDTAVEHTGWSEEELIGRDIHEWLAQGPQEMEVEEVRERLENDETVFATLKREKKDGSTYWAEETIVPFRYGGRDASLVVSRDITDKKRVRQRIEKKQRYLEDIINSVPDPVFVKDRDHNWIMLNDAYCEFMGYSREELLGKTDHDFFPEEEAEVFWEKDEEVFETGEENVNEEKFTDREGVTHTVKTRKRTFRNEEGEQVLVGTIRDISERKEAKMRIEQNKQKIERLHKVSSELQTCQSEAEVFKLAVGTTEEILDFDICSFSKVEDDKIIVKERTSGLPEGDYLERPLEEGGIDAKTYLDQKSYLIKNINKHKDAKPVKSKYRSAISIPIGEYGIFQAVDTEFDHFDEVDLQMGELLMNHVSQALERIQVKKREEFLHSILRHDVKNKIQVAKGYLQLVEEGGAEVEDYSDKLQESIENAEKVIEKVRTLQKLEKSEEKKKIKLSSIVDEVVSEYEEQAEEKGVEIVTRSLGCEVKGGALLSTLFDNLLENSLKHAGCDKIKFSSEIDEDFCVITVEDDGEGIPDSVKEEIFKQGFSQGEYEGSGIGMYIVKEIAESYGGNIEVSDSELGGARFDIKLHKA